MKNIEVIKVCVAATSGSAIGECMREAILLASKEWRNVSLKHNDIVYNVRPNDLINSIEKENEQ